MPGSNELENHSPPAQGHAVDKADAVSPANPLGGNRDFPVCREENASQPPASPQPPPGWIEIGRHKRLPRANEDGLVVLSMGLAYWLMHAEDGYALYVEERHESAVRAQLRKSRAERINWPPIEEMPKEINVSAFSLGIYCLIILTVFVTARQETVDAGSASEAAIHAGEWWRAITALTLHADWAHLAGNLLGGCLFVSLLCRFTGIGVGWVAVLLAGAIGNLLNAAAYAGSGHISIGASTAVFGALGLLVSFRLLASLRMEGLRWPKRLWAPLLAGMALLGLLGTGGERTDVAAHFWGFGVGFCLGALMGYCRLDKWAMSIPQTPLALLPLVAIAVAWWLALQ